ncbi:MAG: glutathione binding-like protein, partial [Cyanobacteria bacterium J06600_6]
LDKQLEDRTFLVGDEFTIADIATYPWARAYYWAKVSVDGLNNLKAWFDRIDERPATQRALEKPKPVPAFFGRGDIETTMASNAARFENN